MKITIKNIKGFGDPPTELDLDLKTDRVNIIFAPNGTGKSSLAKAFKSLTRDRLYVEDEDKYHKDSTLDSELSVTLDGKTYTANKKKNEIGSLFTPVVINSDITVSTTQHNMGGKYTAVSGYMDIEDIEVVNNVPVDVCPQYKIKDFRKDFGTNSKVLENYSDIFLDPSFLQTLVEIGSRLDFYQKANKRKKIIKDIIASIQEHRGTAVKIIDQIDPLLYDKLESNDIYKEIMSSLEPFAQGFSNFQRFDLFYQTLIFWISNKADIRKAKARREYEEWKQKFDANLTILDSTWKSIHSVEKDSKLIVEFPHADEISNGQRDILTFVIELLKFKAKIKANKKYLLIIDEVFDYLDDANIIAAQYFLSNFLKLDKADLYLCIMTHLNPFTFRNYLFPENRVNFLYLKNTVPVATTAMKAFIAFRNSLDRKDSEDDALYGRLSNYLFHYNPSATDLSNDLAARHKPGLKQKWGRTHDLHIMLIDEVNKYFSDQPSYDPYAVAMALRLRVEKIVYEKLPTQNLMDIFIKTKMTTEKFTFAESNGVVVPEALYIINAIHNEADHLKYDSAKGEYVEKAMVYKLQSVTIQSILKHIFGLEDQPLTTNCID